MSGPRSAQTPFEDSRLVAGYTFEEFVVGPHNRFPHAASQAVSENLGKAYNPLFIYGPVGMGKTHLMQAVGHRVLQRNPAAKVLYVTAEQFMMEVIELLQEGNLQAMRERYRQLDILLVDDIQFLATSESTQEEFFHTFNELHHSGKQIIMTSDRPPKMLTTLEDRLRSRFEWGLIADIKQTNLETRVAILRKKESHLSGMQLGDEIRLYIASRLKSNIRELEGFLRRVQAYAKLNSQQISLPLVKEIMRELLPPQEWEEGEDAGGEGAGEVLLPPPHLGPPEAYQGAPEPPTPAFQPPAAPQAPAAGGERSLTESLLELGTSLGLQSSGGPPPAFAPPPAPRSPAPPPTAPVQPGQAWPPRAPAPPPPPPLEPGFFTQPGQGPVTLEPVGPIVPPPQPPPVRFVPPSPPPPPMPAAPAAPAFQESFAPPPAPPGGGLEPLSVSPAPAGTIPVGIFFPKGRMGELAQLKQRFQDIIRKHKLKFEMHPALEAGYPADQSLAYPSFLEACQTHQLSIAIVLGPPSDARIQETIFHQRLQDTFEPNEISLQFVPWDELAKDYRYLNIALDITLIRFNKQKGKK